MISEIAATLGVAGLVASGLLTIVFTAGNKKQYEFIPSPDGQTYLIEGWHDVEDVIPSFSRFLSEEELLPDDEIELAIGGMHFYKSYYSVARFNYDVFDSPGEYYYIPAGQGDKGAIQVSVINIP